MRTISRKRLRTLFRSTAPPSLLEVIKPTLVSFDGDFFNTLSTMNLPWQDSPSVFTLLNSPTLDSLADFGNRYRMASATGVVEM